MQRISRRKFMRDVGAAGVALGLPLERLAGFAAPDGWNAGQSAAGTDPYALVDPDLVRPLRAFHTVVFNKDILPTMRDSPVVPVAPPPAPQPSTKVIPGAKGVPELKLLIVDPTPGKKNRPAYLHIHGGGYVAGRPETFPMLTQRVAQECRCLVVSVDYRLAPETHFPGSLEDNYHALGWIYENADQLGVDRKRIAIGGESAGGGHSAMLAIAARDRKEYPIVFQVLIYPMLDDRTGSTRPVPAEIGTFVWTRQSNVFGWTSLLGVPAGSDKIPKGAVPARVEDLTGLPPAYIGVGTLDLFVDEDIEYARRLINAGVPTELQVVPGAYHGFNLIAPDAPVSVRFDQGWIRALKQALTAQ
jgi:acetyl esterase/lipase